MNPILSFTAPHKCRPGMLAFHPEYGVCEVIAASGAMRTLLHEVRTPDLVPDTSDLEPGEDPATVLFSESIEVIEVIVNVNDLREVQPDRDPMKQPVSRIMGLNRRRPAPQRPTASPEHHLERDQAVVGLNAPIKCPVGALVHHPAYGICEVTAVDGVMRTVFYEFREPNPPVDVQDAPETTDEWDWNESISGDEAVVPVDELRWLRPGVNLAVKPAHRLLTMPIRNKRA